MKTAKKECDFEWRFGDTLIMCEREVGHRGVHRFIHKHGDGEDWYEYPNAPKSPGVPPRA